MRLLVLGVVCAEVVCAQVGAGNATAAAIAAKSPIVKQGLGVLALSARRIQDPELRAQTIEILENEAACIVHRRGVRDAAKTEILAKLIAEGLLDQADGSDIPGGLKSGIFPAVANENSACPHYPQRLLAAPGSSFGGHHSYPGGLVVHEMVNSLIGQNLVNVYRRVYGMPDFREDITIAAPLWHDWAKVLVFQWNADGTEFRELAFGGSGTKTGAHHILPLAEAMARGLGADFVITQAFAHYDPATGEKAVVNWLRAAAIIARVDPVKRGYLQRDGDGQWSLPNLRSGQTRLLAEYIVHNLSDADYRLTGPAMAAVEPVLRQLAPEFGIAASGAEFNTHFRNVVLSCLSAESLFVILSNRGVDGVRREIRQVLK